ncbi:retrovirus-related pol polyprotein from transposon TNT 1-94 [Tanacetum coccineum]
MGVVERRNRTLMEAARTMLIFAKAPLFLWAEAVATACYTLNRSLRFATLLPLLGVKQMSPETLKELQDESVSESKGRIVVDSIAERLTPPTVYKFKTDCSIIPVWSGRSRSALVKDPEPPSVPPTKKQVTLSSKELFKVPYGHNIFVTPLNRVAAEYGSESVTS